MPWVTDPACINGNLELFRHFDRRFKNRRISLEGQTFHLYIFQSLDKSEVCAYLQEIGVPLDAAEFTHDSVFIEWINVSLVAAERDWRPFRRPFRPPDVGVPGEERPVRAERRHAHAIDYVGRWLWHAS